MPKYPDVKVQLSGEDGNAFAIMGRVGRALARAKAPQKDLDKFYADCMSKDYNNLLQTCMKWVDVS